MKRILLCLAFVCGAAALLRAQEAPKPIKLTVSRAAEPEPALKYELLPPLRERKPGNAALLYYRAGILARSDNPETMKNIVQWGQQVPLDALPRDQVRELLQSHRGALDELGLAARRNRCDWLLPLEEQGASAVLLPELQELRNLGRLLVLQIRLQMVEGRTQEALESLQVGFALARHTSEGPTLVHGLVGVAITGLMNGELEELIGQPDTPNLYWALTALPHPLVDLHAAMETERDFLFLDLPMLRGASQAPLSEEEVQKLRQGILRILAEANSKNLDLDAGVAKAYPAAKEKLIQRGAPAEVVAKMSPLQVVAADAAYTYERLRDGMFKWYHLPYRQAKEHLEEAQRAVEAADEALPFAKILLPAVERVHATGTRLQRDVAALRCVEAIRMYAAAHDGKLPEKLADVTQVPVPEDPFTGEPFSYTLQDGVGIVESAPPGLAVYARRYEITIRR